MFSAKIDTSVKWVISRSTAIAPRIAIMPTSSGRVAEIRPPNTHTSTRKLSGTAIASMRTRSCLVCSLICLMIIELPPAATVTPSRSPTTFAANSAA